LIIAVVVSILLNATIINTRETGDEGGYRVGYRGCRGHRGNEGKR
jgi:hypothetical protein